MNNTELILNEDGSIYHLNLLPKDIAQTIILVGDPERVEKVSCYFDVIEIKKHKREFITHTGIFKGKKLTVLSTGIGISNIEIVMNELDSLVSIDFKTKQLKNEKKSLNLIRIGTSGSLDKAILVDDFLISKQAIGFDGMMNFYPEYEFQTSYFQEFQNSLKEKNLIPLLYDSSMSEELFLKFKDIQHLGITATLPGFYAPQGRSLRLKTLNSNFLDELNFLGIINFEMETAAIYAFSHLLGHQAISINAILANRKSGTFSNHPKETEKKLIQWTLERI